MNWRALLFPLSIKPMKKHVIGLLVLVAFGFSSWTTLNSNTWNIKIGEKYVLSSRKNEIGDTAFIAINDLKQTDTLFVSRYLCGYRGQNCTTRLSIRNEQNELVQETIREGFCWGFEGQMPLSAILKSTKFRTGETLSIYFSYNSNSNGEFETLLLGRLKFE